MYSSGKDSYTEGSVVIISSKLNEKEFDSTVGLALHEGSHCALTDFQALKRFQTSGRFFEVVKKAEKAFPGAANNPLPDIKALVNIIEDRRIDQFIYKSAPGYNGYYQAMYDTYFNNPIITQALINNWKTEVTMDCYMFHICNFANPNRNLQALPKLQEIWDEIGLSTISRLKTTSEVIEVACNVWEIIISALHEARLNQAKPKQETPKQQPTNANQDTQKPEPPKENEDPNLDLPDNQMQTLEKGDGESSQETESSEEEIKGEPKGETKGDDSEQTSDNQEVEETEEDEENTMTPKQQKELAEAVEDQKDFLQGKVEKKNLTKNTANLVNAAAEADLDFETVGFDDSVLTLSKKSKTKCIVLRGFDEKLLATRCLASHWEAQPLPGKERAGIMEAIEQGYQLGILLGKRLKTRDESRDLRTTRLDSGRIDKRLIAELGFGNDKVFSNTIHYTVTPSYLHVSIDASGSMSGSKWNRSIKTAIAIAKAASMTNSIHCQISIRGEFEAMPSEDKWNAYSHGTRYPLVWVVYDSKKDAINSFKQKAIHLYPGSSTPEGLCFEAMQETINRDSKSKTASFINLSDGMPQYQNPEIKYYGDAAAKHTLQQTKNLSKSCKVISYYIDNNISARSRNAFQQCYGSFAEFIDESQLAQLAKSVNNMLQRPIQ
jgi:hypothetical protein